MLNTLTIFSSFPRESERRERKEPNVDEFIASALNTESATVAKAELARKRPAAVDQRPSPSAAAVAASNGTRRTSSVNVDANAANIAAADEDDFQVRSGFQPV